MSLRGKLGFLTRAWPYLRDELEPEWKYLRRWVSAAAKARFRTSRFDSVSTFVLFLAHQRTGHSLMGQLLNAHPSVLISHELDALEYVRRGLSSQETLFSLIHDRELWFRRREREWAGYDYRVPGGAQKDSNDVSAIGDKAGGMSAGHLRSDPDLVTQLASLLDIDLRIIHVERHPLDAIASEHREYRPTLLGTIAQFFDQCDGIQGVLASQPSGDILTIYFEDFVRETIPHLETVADFLDLDPDPEWLEACDNVVYDQPSVSRDTVEWTRGKREAVAALSRDYTFLDRYDFDQ